MGNPLAVKITADQVKELRERTGAGMMDCKRALEDAQGDSPQAEELLRQRGAARVAQRAGRMAKEGLIDAYVHLGGKIGVLVELNCETDFVARTPEVRSLARDLAMHIAATNPMAIRREELDPENVERERRIYRAQAQALGKPEPIVEKIVAGKLEKFYQEVCLLEQPFVKDPDKTVGQLITGVASQVGENLVFRRFERFQLGG